MTPNDNEVTEESIILYKGGPNKPSVGETGKFNAFKKFLGKYLWPATKKAGLWGAAGGDLAKQYAEAKVITEKNQGAKIGEEAAILAAKADNQRQINVQVSNAEIEKIYTNNLPQEAKLLQMANLIAANPAIKDQLELVIGMMGHLKVMHGVQIQPIAEEPVPDESAAIALLTSNFDEAADSSTKQTTAWAEIVGTVGSFPVSSLEFSLRTLKALEQHKINYINDLTAFTEHDLLALDGFGATSVSEIKQLLAVYKLQLAPE